MGGKRMNIVAAMAALLCFSAAMKGGDEMLMRTDDGLGYYRTPDERFENLPGYDFAPRYLEFRGLRMHYVEEGPGDAAPVLLLHGEPSWSYLYRKMIPIIAGAGHRAIAPDLPGFGRSDKPARRRDYSYQFQVDAVTHFIRELDLTHITLVCQDWGGLIGLRVAAENPERFDRIVAANTALLGHIPGPNSRLPVGLKNLVGFSAWLTYSQLTPVFKAGQIVQFGTVEKMPPEVVAAYDAPFPDRRFLAGARMMPALVPTQMRQNSQAWQTLVNWEKPFLTAFSDKDPILGGGEATFKEVIPGAQGQPHVIIRGAGHFLQEDKGEELAQVVIDFIARTR